MKHAGRRRWLLLLALCAGAASGCHNNGVTHNPSYFPWLYHHFGDIIPTHAKPPGHGYYANFDPNAVRLEIRPLEATNQVRTQHVIIATVYDQDNQPRRNRRIEWMLEGVGNIIEVDEHGIFPGRGYKTDNKHAVSYTAIGEHRITRGNDNPNDDFVIRPGQTWCVISSAVEGDTHITAYAPGIQNWEKGRVVVTARWVDANWEFPPPAVARAGGEHVFTTKIFRHTDRQPLAGYRVRYKIVDGPPAVFVPSRTSEYTATSDLSGLAQVAISELQPVQGVNRVSVEIIRPPDPTAPSGAGIVIARGETNVEWVGPSVQLNHTGPPLAVVGQEVTYTTTLNNTGRVEAKFATITSEIPDGLEFVRSQPPGTRQGNQVFWPVGLLPPGQSAQIQSVYRATKPVNAVHCVDLETAEGQRDRKCVNTQIATAALRVSINAPATGVINQPITYQITVSNPSAAPLTQVGLTAQYDEGLEHESKARSVTLDIGTLAPGESKNAALALTPRQAGKFRTQVVATSGQLSDQAIHEVTVGQPQMSLLIEGPNKRYKGRPAEYTIKIANPGDTPLNNVVVRDKLPQELEFLNASQGGQFVAGEVVWNLGVLQGKQEMVLTLNTRGRDLTKAAVQNVTVTADPGVRKDAQAALEIFGLPALQTVVGDQGDPVTIGGKVTYEIKITNQGTLPAKDIEVKATLPAEVKLVNAQGPAQANVLGNVLAFPKIADLDPGKTLTYRIEAEAVRSGDVRFRVEVRSPSLEAGPILEEESTRIFDAQQEGLPAPPVPPPPKL